jgi:hypothetical protein
VTACDDGVVFDERWTARLRSDKRCVASDDVHASPDTQDLARYAMWKVPEYARVPLTENTNIICIS